MDDVRRSEHFLSELFSVKRGVVFVKRAVLVFDFDHQDPVNNSSIRSNQLRFWMSTDGVCAIMRASCFAPTVHILSKHVFPP